MHDREPTGEGRGVLRVPGEGELLTSPGVEHLFLLTSADTGGAAAFEEFALAPGAVGARPHVHESHDEYLYVLEGVLTLHTGDGEVAARAGSLFAAPRGTPHGFRNAGASVARAVCFYTPGGYEEYHREVAAAVAGGAVVDDDLLATLRARHGTRPHGGGGAPG